jgi:hypothetical protein
MNWARATRLKFNDINKMDISVEATNKGSDYEPVRC